MPMLAAMRTTAPPSSIGSDRLAIRRSANEEAIRHLSRGLECLLTLPQGRERDRRELALRNAVGGPLIATRGYAAPEVGEAYGRARVLCERFGETAPLFAALSGEFVYHFVRGDYRMMRKLADETRCLSERSPDLTIRLAAHRLAAITAMQAGASSEARAEFERAASLTRNERERGLLLARAAACAPDLRQLGT